MHFVEGHCAGPGGWLVTARLGRVLALLVRPLGRPLNLVIRADRVGLGHHNLGGDHTPRRRQFVSPPRGLRCCRRRRFALEIFKLTELLNLARQSRQGAPQIRGPLLIVRVHTARRHLVGVVDPGEDRRPTGMGVMAGRVTTGDAAPLRLVRLGER